MINMCNIDDTIEADINKMAKLLETHEDRYMSGNNSIYFGGTNFGKLFDIQAYAYDYYCFFKNNYLMLDWFTNPKQYLENYIKALLCTYFPQSKSIYAYEFGSRIGNQSKPYQINEIDLDIMVKFSNVKKFRNWTEKYKLKNITFEKDYNITLKYSNLIKKVALEPLAFNEKLEVFSILLTLLDLEFFDLGAIITTFSKIVNQLNNRVRFLFYLLPSLLIILEGIGNSDLEEIQLLAKSFLTEEVFNYMQKERKNELIRLIDVFSKSNLKLITEEQLKRLLGKSEIDNSNSERAFLLRKFFCENQKELYKKYLAQTDNIANEQWIFLITEEYLEYNDKMLDDMMVKIDESIKNRKKSKMIDLFEGTDALINDLIILWNFGKISFDEFSLFRKYTNNSIFLDMIFNPEKFDYNKFDINHYTWSNLINNDIVLKDILTYGKDTIRHNMKRKVSNNLANEKELEFYYKYLN